MIIHISKNEAQTLLNAVQDAMTTARGNLEDCYQDDEFAEYCEAFFKSFDLEQKIKGWLKDDKKT